MLFVKKELGKRREGGREGVMCVWFAWRVVDFQVAGKSSTTP